MKVECKVWPVQEPHPAFPREKSTWAPIIPVRLIYRHSPPSRRIEAVVDSGSPYCLFHSDVCQSLGIRRLEDGIEESLKGVVGGQNAPEAPMYFHKIKIMVVADQFETMVGFSPGPAVGGILGRRGFFENFTVKFDCSVDPPSMEIEYIHRT